MRHTVLRVFVPLVLTAQAAGCMNAATLNDILSTGPGALDEDTVVRGLKQALRIGTDRAVATTSEPDGFFGNPALQIPLPENVQGLANRLRSLGFAAQVDEFELAMNRGAEMAAAEAAPVFVDAITSMSISQAFEILRGDDTEATEYFRGRTTEELESRFRPIVTEKLNEVGVYRAYDRVVTTAKTLLQDPPVFDPTEYVTDKALDGLFLTLGEEERRIREDPAARTTELLRRVFGPRTPHRGFTEGS